MDFKSFREELVINQVIDDNKEEKSNCWKLIQKVVHTVFTSIKGTYTETPIEQPVYLKCENSTMVFMENKRYIRHHTNA